MIIFAVIEYNFKIWHYICSGKVEKRLFLGITGSSTTGANIKLEEYDNKKNQ